MSDGRDRLQIMNEFQAAQRKRLEEPAADIGLEPFCAMVHLLAPVITDGQ